MMRVDHRARQGPCTGSLPVSLGWTTASEVLCTLAVSQSHLNLARLWQVSPPQYSRGTLAQWHSGWQRADFNFQEASWQEGERAHVHTRRPVLVAQCQRPVGPWPALGPGEPRARASLTEWGSPTRSQSRWTRPLQPLSQPPHQAAGGTGSGSGHWQRGGAAHDTVPVATAREHSGRSVAASANRGIRPGPGWREWASGIT